MVLRKMREIINKYIAILRWKLSLYIPTKISPDDAFTQLSNFYFQPRPSFIQDNMVRAETDLQIIVPVYNVENYIDDCIHSILSQQTSFSYCIFFVDDGSNDNSGNILDKYRNVPGVKIFHEKNGGVSRARNVALQNICGKYVMFMDSDDMLSPGAIQVLMETAISHNAEIVEGSYRVFDIHGMKDVFSHTDKTCAYRSCDLFGFPWGKVIRSDCLKNFCFPEGFLFEDTVMSTLLYPECSNAYAVPDVVYYYRRNPAGISNTSIISKKCIDTFWIMKYCLEERVRRGQCLQMRDLERYLFAVYRNWGRTREMPDSIQESIFLLSCQIIRNTFCDTFAKYSGKYRRIFKSVSARSYKSFLILAKDGYIE